MSPWTGENIEHGPERHLPEICRLAREQDCRVIVDAVCTLSTMPFEMDHWGGGVDAVITGGQKGLAPIPGVSLVAISERAWGHIGTREDRLRHWCLDAKLANRCWNGKAYHYTAPVSGVLALHETLRLICRETLEARFDRHLRCSTALQSGIESMGPSLYTRPLDRLNSMIGINVPEGVESRRLLAHMSGVHRVEISGSFGLDIIRIGQMGEQSRSHHIFRTLHALGASLYALGIPGDIPAGVAALESTLDAYIFDGPDRFPGLRDFPRRVTTRRRR